MMIVGLLLIAACAIFAFCLIVQSVTYLTRRQYMKLGGGGYMFMIHFTLILSLSMLVFSVMLTISHFNDTRNCDTLSAIFVFLSAVSCFFYLKGRQKQYQGMMLAMQSTDTVKLTHNNMIANISHEIRTPLNTIMGLTEVMSHREGVSGQMADDLGNIAEAGTSLLAVVNNLIDFSKIQSGRLNLIESDYDTKEMLSTIISRANQTLKDSSVEFLADIDSNTPSILRGDDVRLIQAITNIISNSCRFTHIGVITFRLSCVREHERVLLRFDVEDTGVGIREDEQRDLFSAYSERKFGDDHKRMGAGLGLVITKNIVDAMGGKISFVSEEGSGTSFTVEVTQTIVDPRPIGVVDGQIELAKPESRYMFTAPMARVLVVDDNIVNLFVAKELLSNYELDITTAASGEECIQLLNNNYYDIIFMDYVMPDMDGHETLLEIRKQDNDYFRNIPIVALTAQIVNGSEKVYMDEGFQGYLPKPININDLETILIRLLPEEYICRKVTEGVQNDSNKLEDKAWFNRFKSVLVDFDVVKGLGYCNNDYTSYLNLLRVIYNDSFTQSARLKSYVDSSNYDAYRVAVHAMKSVTASAGAEKLSFICLEHENAAKNCDGEYIRNHIGTLLSEYDVFLKEIETLLQRESEMMNRGCTVRKVNAESTEIQALAGRLLASLEDYNIDEAEETIKKLLAINLHPSQEKTIESVRDLLLVFKYEEAIAAIKNEFME